MTHIIEVGEKIERKGHLWNNFMRASTPKKIFVPKKVKMDFIKTFLEVFFAVVRIIKQMGINDSRSDA